ncbi:hypothetical protein P296_04960 [Salmonella enterica subsp. arizonae serovar 18:z4,z23:- str. CVM N26624]|nr:hypothetical protein P296_04960 [Salmonella enterica subsp. arizonae serovar 18:z4,z23:- str. CVM N26624]OLW12650.1 hypothetical protein P295_07875 [Salmonella enterica subsp. arizonae serovar 18:z4,z23:- str. CVM N25373]OLY08945.1 hypothetical protein P300_11075 [Salmonella enterica subsp. arizonae serovar 18:z4,z23:- str. CVM N29354]
MSAHQSTKWITGDIICPCISININDERGKFSRSGKKPGEGMKT